MNRWIGLDVSQTNIFVKESYLDGTCREYDFPYTEDALRAFEAQLRPDDGIAMEATLITYYLYKRFKKLVSEVLIANPMKLKLISKNPAKNDRNDAGKIVTLYRLGYLPTIWLPDEETKQDREILQLRYTLSRDLTRVKNRIRAHLSKQGLTCRARKLESEDAQLFLQKILSNLDWVARVKLESLLRQMNMLCNEIQRIGEVIETRADRCPEVSLLMTIHGMNTLTAFIVTSVIGDITRFQRPESLANYAGLIPSLRASSKRSWSGPITKAGSKMLRWAISQVVHCLIRQPGYFQNFYRRLCRRKTKGIALVACGRKLLEIIWHMLSRNEPFREMKSERNEKKQNERKLRPRARKTEPFETLPALAGNHAILRELSTSPSSDDWIPPELRAYAKVRSKYLQAYTKKLIENSLHC